MKSEQGSGWVEQPRVRRFWTTSLAITGVAALALGAAMTFDGDLRAVPVFLAGGPLVLVPAFRDRARRAPYDYEGKYGAGLALPLRAMSWALIVAVSAWAVLVALVVVAVWVDPESTTAEKFVGAPLCGLLSVALAAVATGGVVARLMKDRMILMDVDGLFINAPAGTARMPWHAVRSVRRRWLRLEGKYKSSHDDAVLNYVELCVDTDLVEGALKDALAHVGEDGLVFNRDDVAMDPDLAVAVVEFYLENPEERGDLRTVVALDRVASIARGLDPA